MDAQTIDRIVNLGQTGKLVDVPEGHHPVAIEGTSLVSLEKFAEAPYLITEDRKLPSLKAFTDYLAAFKQDNTVVFADTTTQKLQAVIDYHGTTKAKDDPIDTVGSPSWCKHKAEFSLQMDEDFKHFLALDKKDIAQDDLVIELTDYQAHFIVPAPADVLGLVGDVQIVDSKELASKVGSGNLNTLYKQDKSLKAKGNTSFPEQFKVVVPVFKGFPTRYELPFRLMRRCGEETRGKLVFSIRLIRPHAILEAAFQDVCKQVTDAVPDISLFGADPAFTSKTL